ncbi:MAG: hypothetical protein JWL63_3193 [Rhodocyclales bacterium]|nr:hypothetical protein [Rhodocyclales bacterium]
MKIYNYDASGAFLKEADADADPLELDQRQRALLEELTTAASETLRAAVGAVSEDASEDEREAVVAAARDTYAVAIASAQEAACAIEPDTWLVPAFATTIAPPAARDGFYRVFAEGAWTEVPMPAAPPVIEPTHNETIQAQIIALESTVSQRRLREAVLGIDSGWLANLDSQIATLRGELT